MPQADEDGGDDDDDDAITVGAPTPLTPRPPADVLGFAPLAGAVIDSPSSRPEHDGHIPLPQPSPLLPRTASMRNLGSIARSGGFGKNFSAPDSPVRRSMQRVTSSPMLSLHKEVGPEDFRILKLIGRGDVGRVYLVNRKGTKHLYAMKVLSKEEMLKRQKVRQAWQGHRHGSFVVVLTHACTPRFCSLVVP